MFGGNISGREVPGGACAGCRCLGQLSPALQVPSRDAREDCKGEEVSPDSSGYVGKQDVGKKTLCLDLNTILLTLYLYAAEDTDATLILSDTKEEISIKLNPFTFDFLDDMKSRYELILYSSLSRKYLRAILAYLEREKQYFDYSFDESLCLFANVFHGVKCLNFLCASRSPADIVAVDTSVKNFPLNPTNVVPFPWISRPPSIALVKLGAVLELIAKESDVRAEIKKYSTKFRGNTL